MFSIAEEALRLLKDHPEWFVIAYRGYDNQPRGHAGKAPGEY